MTNGKPDSGSDARVRISSLNFREPVASPHSTRVELHYRTARSGSDQERQADDEATCKGGRDGPRVLAGLAGVSGSKETRTTLPMPRKRGMSAANCIARAPREIGRWADGSAARPLQLILGGAFLLRLHYWPQGPRSPRAPRRTAHRPGSYADPPIAAASRRKPSSRLTTGRQCRARCVSR